MNVVLIAEEGSGLAALAQLQASGHRVQAVLSDTLAAPGSAGARAHLPPDVPLWPARLLRAPGAAAQLGVLAPDVLLNVHSLRIVPPAVLALPACGAFNLHPGPLPGYAGLNVPSWAILNGETRHGVTLHWMDAGIDTGDVAYAAELPVEPDDTGLTLSLRCAQAEQALLAQLLADLSAGTVPRRPQPAGPRRYCRAGAPHGGRADWRWPARTLDAFVRACDYRPYPSPWGAPRAAVAGTELALLEVGLTAEATRARPGTLRWDGEWLDVATGDEWLALDLVEVGGQTLTGAALAARLGPDLQRA
ncbi:methionyl-tRNA formyltransferase [Deinococcus kurensis]|uniref:methionyl-tRNA formyltransferase n=1 Tax=Deinococcus kurensis TaxID=2662757 RepID=UPI0012D2A7F7|nr:formyltransferase family protein [Deinococcus kurensis]